MSNTNDTIYIDIPGQTVSELDPNNSNSNSDSDKDKDSYNQNNNSNNNCDGNVATHRKRTSNSLSTSGDTCSASNVLDINNNGLSESNTLSDPIGAVEGGEATQKLYEKLLRSPEQVKVTNIELFFDLVFVYAISAISETMVEDLTWEVVLEMLIVTLAVWWSWIFSAWTFNYLNPDSYEVRIFLMGSMLISLVMSAVIPESYTDKSLVFAGMYVLIQLGRSFWATFVLRGHGLMWTYLRLSIWHTGTAVMWLVGGAIGGTTRNVLWTVAIVIEYLSVTIGNYVPERCSLFIIIALGESIVVTGEAFREVLHQPAGVSMFIISFFGAAAMWWIYFHTASSEATEYVEHSNDPGKIGRSAYTYIHVIMVIGIIWSAVADRISIDLPYMVPHREQGKMIYVAMTIGGPALFVFGHALFRRTFRPRFSIPHLITVVVLICATPIGIFLPLWATAVTTTSILMLLAFYEAYFSCAILPAQVAFMAEP
ncbi:hypothetical protein EMPS_04997 [Entomortierella parvispora]|uniref:Low temperature requirement protein A n=1 Tax=Entomortierella parvispora TaxID=205924 RepID=A0A9P3LW39_9FUNG|nr:hypothetical protein EMPS_04997 [Entomortierella parvispora]